VLLRQSFSQIAPQIDGFSLADTLPPLH